MRAARKSAKRKTATGKATPAAKPAKKKTAKAVGKKTAAARPARKTARSSPARSPAKKSAPTPDFTAFPPESLTESKRSICLACVMDVFTRHMGLAPRTAYGEIKQYTPSIPELVSPPARPYFDAQERCPFCDSPPKWHAELSIHRIESGKATDAPRRKLIGSLAAAEEFAILEEKATQQHAFFDWLDKISEGLNLEGSEWLRDVTHHYLGRKEPKTDWQAEFRGIHSVRRSRRLDQGWESETGRLFLAPMLFDEILLVQYLVSRSHRAGGLTFEGRYTFAELLARLRHSGYLRHVGVETRDATDVLDRLMAFLGGEGSLRYYYVVDRREFLERAKSIQALPIWRVRRPVA